MKHLLTIAGLVLLCSGCAHRETVALLPAADGSTGSLTVVTKGSVPLQLKQAYATAQVSGETVTLGQSSKNEVDARFADALSARPVEPVRFVLYFMTDSDKLTPESAQQISGVFAEIKQRPVPDVQVVGHTDRVGSVVDNDRLALKRAEKIRNDLIQLGIEADNVSASGRGEREPLVPTNDEVAEPRNRRVELYVR